MPKKTVLLHSCCAPCSIVPVECLQMQDFEIVGFFSNSNIHPETEYRKRLAEYQKLFQLKKLNYEVDLYTPSCWFDMTRGYELEPERGKRCRICIYERLKKTAKFAKINGINYITTTLTVSPYKNSDMIFEIGRELNLEYGVRFLELDFKKKGGFNRAQQLAREYGFYIQRYCGCYFSIRPETKKNRIEEKAAVNF